MELAKEHVTTFEHFAKLSFYEQGIAFLNAFWDEVGDQAEFMWEAYKIIRQADMHTKGISFVLDYHEACDLDFTAGLYFYEKLFHYVNEDPAGKKWAADKQYGKSMPEMMTAIERKKALREQDVNFDDRISFLEYLLYQYKDIVHVNEFAERAAKTMDTDSNPELAAAREALAEVNAKIVEFEKAKRKLTEELRSARENEQKARIKQKQFELKGLRGKFKEQGLDAALLKSQAMIRKFSKLAEAAGNSGKKGNQPQGTAWWLARELKEKKALYGDNPALIKKKPAGPRGKAKKSNTSWMK